MDNKELPEEQLQQLLINSRNEREQKCWKDIQECLVRYKCYIEIEMLISAKGNLPQIKIIAQ
jgi:hypothetical protein